MKDFGLKKYVVPEVVLLAILLVGLIISHSIVLSRSYIKLSTPSEVPASGFSFSMPKGGGWQTMPALKFAQNSWYLTSVQESGGKSATRLTVSYLVAEGHPDVNDWLKSRAAQLGQRLGRSRIIKGKDLVIHAAMVDLQGQPLNIYYAIALLPGGRSAMIELIDTTDDPQWGWKVLTRVAESFVFKGNPLLQDGEKVIASMRSKGLGQLLGTTQANYFLMSIGDKPEGFYVDMYAQITGEAAMKVRAVNSYYVQHLGGQESILQTNDRFDRFLWSSNTISSSGARTQALELRLDADATMGIRQGGRLIATYVPGPAAIPDLFSVALFRQMIADGTKQALVDFINQEAQIVPVAVQLQSQQADPNSRAAHIIRVAYFGDKEISEEIHLDADGLVVKDIVSGKTPYALTRGSRDDIINEFPLWLDYIMNLDNLLKKDIMDDGKDLRRIVWNAGTII